MPAGPLPQMTPEDARADHRAMLRFLGFNALAGAAIGLCVAASILWLDIGGIGALVARSTDPFLPVLLLAGPLAIVFAAAVAGSAIMLLPYSRKFADKRKD